VWIRQSGPVLVLVVPKQQPGRGGGVSLGGEDGAWWPEGVVLLLDGDGRRLGCCRLPCRAFSTDGLEVVVGDVASDLPSERGALQVGVSEVESD
jgi:hypothetical protein